MYPIASSNFLTNDILSNVIDFLAPVVAIVAIVFCVVQAAKLLKGSESGSVKKLVGGFLLFLFILGIMYAAGSYETYGRAFQGITDSVIQKGSRDAGKIVG